MEEFGTAPPDGHSGPAADADADAETDAGTDADTDTDAEMDAGTDADAVVQYGFSGATS